MYYPMCEVARTPVAQLDSASVFGTDDKNPQAQKKQGLTSRRKSARSACAASETKTAQSPADLAKLAGLWLHLPGAIKAAILQMAESVVENDTDRHEHETTKLQNSASGKDSDGTE